MRDVAASSDGFAGEMPGDAATRAEPLYCSPAIARQDRNIAEGSRGCPARPPRENPPSKAKALASRQRANAGGQITSRGQEGFPPSAPMGVTIAGAQENRWRVSLPGRLPSCDG